MPGRLKEIHGLDYKKGAREYPERLAPADHHHLYTKPFYNLANKVARWSGDGLDADTQRHFCDFANIAQALALPAGATILDVGCGPGWLSEYFARLGYQVTGLDISPELIRIAEERLARLPFGLDHESPVKFRFVVHDIELEPLPENFDAIICYDALHHFSDEHAVMRHLAAMLKTGGQLFVAEGEQPAAGSPEENELREVMEKFETLETPFSRDYLMQLIREAGLAVVGDYASVTGFVDRDNLDGNSVRFVETPAFNYLLCKKVDSETKDSVNPGRLLAGMTLADGWPQEVSPGAELEFQVAAENLGDTVWLVSHAPLKGRVRVGLKIIDEAGAVVEEIHGWPRLQQAVAPGENVSLKIRLTAPKSSGHYRLVIDLLDQDICWFAEHGSRPLEISFAVS